MNLIIVLIISIIYRIADSADYCDGVKEWGFHCQTCKSMVNCIQLPSGNWQTISIGECDNTKNEYCNRKNKTCSTESDCLIETPVTFECNVEGTFPDPYDCDKYHVCAYESGVLKTFNMKCSNNEFGYSAKTKECSLNKTTSKYCKNRQFICKKSGHMASWPENSQIFYVCVQKKVVNDIIIYPKLFECQYGEHFNGEQCLKNNIIDGTTIIPSITSTGNDGEPIIPSTEHPIIGLCKKEGLFKNPNDCRKYYICRKNLSRKEITCPNHTHFDDRIKACVMGGNC